MDPATMAVVQMLLSLIFRHLEQTGKTEKEIKQLLFDEMEKFKVNKPENLPEPKAR